jgi:RHS repeat-associated protein
MHPDHRQNTLLDGLIGGYEALFAFPHRFTFNGKESDSEVKGEGNSLDFGARVYDSRLGRFLTIDPDNEKFAATSPFVYTYNNPLFFIDKNGETGVASIEGNTIVIRATIIYYGDINLADARDMTNQIQNVCNSVHHEDGSVGLGRVEIEGRTYNVRFEITAEVITKAENETEEEYYFRVGNEMGSYDPSFGDVRNRNPENNFVRVGPETAVRNVSTYSGDGGYFVKTETDIYSKTPTHEFWHGLVGLGVPVHELKPTSDGRPNISASRTETSKLNDRVVTQYDIYRLKLDKILCKNNTTGVVGSRAGNSIYDETGNRIPSVTLGEGPTNNENCK